MNLRTIESLLRAHPGVRDASVMAVGSETVAFLVPNDSYLRDTLGWGAESSSLVGRWKRTYDFSYRGVSEAARSEFVGWNSSYTGQPIPEADMREWLDASVASVLQFQPRRVYEVGCGNGLMLTRVAPHCERYVGADFAPSALRRLENSLLETPDVAAKVRLLERSANDTTELALEGFDFALLNSVVQYFPDHPYLTDVLTKLLELLRPGGHVFLGDVIHLPLRKLFATSVEWSKASGDVDVAELRRRITHRITVDPELSLSPAFFVQLVAKDPRWTQVSIAPRRGRASTEMTKYRYQVVLHKHNDAVSRETVEFLDWRKHRWTLREIAAVVRQRGSVGFTRIANRRLAEDLWVASALAAAEASIKISEVARAPHEVDGVDPEDLFALAEELGKRVEISWRSCCSEGSFDAAFLDPRDASQCLQINWPEPTESDFVQIASSPRQQKHLEQLREALLRHLGDAQASAPSRWIIVQNLPRTSDGATNDRALRAYLEERERFQLADS